MEMPRIAVGSLGGTITMTGSEGGPVRPTLTADDLIADVPELAKVAQCAAETITTRPGASLSSTDISKALSWAHSAADKGAGGVVLIQGTDTIEETAFLLDLYWGRDEPLIITGAMRHPETSGADGPGNLLASVRAAASGSSRGRGVLVVLNDTIHSAINVTKGRGSGPAAFVSRGAGPEGWIEEGIIHYGLLPSRTHPLGGGVASVTTRVALLQTHLDDDGSLIDRAVEAGYAAVVLSTFGVGHVPRSVAEAVSRVVTKVPVVIATGTGSGTTYRDTYGFEGSETDLIARGAIPGGWLSPRKARLLLAELVAKELNQTELSRTFRDRGQLNPRELEPYVSTR